MNKKKWEKETVVEDVDLYFTHIDSDGLLFFFFTLIYLIIYGINE